MIMFRTPNKKNMRSLHKSSEADISSCQNHTPLNSKGNGRVSPTGGEGSRESS
ncbi:uncharacterized protein BDV17DRAFT_276079 [Aspergillus undulatus]|uniref:uncharacterized protein n=1 Tax=Aspergillus undulatus TaxID=1810928 RepID=UPI003CCD7233